MNKLNVVFDNLAVIKFVFDNCSRRVYSGRNQAVCTDQLSSSPSHSHAQHKYAGYNLENRLVHGQNIEIYTKFAFKTYYELLDF